MEFKRFKFKVLIVIVVICIFALRAEAAANIKSALIGQWFIQESNVKKYLFPERMDIFDDEVGVSVSNNLMRGRGVDIVKWRIEGDGQLIIIPPNEAASIYSIVEITDSTLVLERYLPVLGHARTTYLRIDAASPVMEAEAVKAIIILCDLRYLVAASIMVLFNSTNIDEINEEIMTTQALDFCDDDYKAKFTKTPGEYLFQKIGDKWWVGHNLAVSNKPPAVRERLNRLGRYSLLFSIKNQIQANYDGEDVVYMCVNY